MNRCPPPPQSGMALLLCLLFLTALTLLGLSAAADAILQKQLAANLQDTERARQSALAALSWAEDWLLDLQGAVPPACLAPCDGLNLYPAGTLPPHPESEDLSWWRTQGYEAGIDPLSGNRLATFSTGSANPPMWVVSLAHEIPAPEGGTATVQSWYRILARGNGQSDTAVTVVESIVEKSWPADAGSGTGTGGRVSWRELR